VLTICQYELYKLEKTDKVGLSCASTIELCSDTEELSENVLEKFFPNDKEIILDFS
jgi:hypothetical protein